MESRNLSRLIQLLFWCVPALFSINYITSHTRLKQILNLERHQLILIQMYIIYARSSFKPGNGQVVSFWHHTWISEASIEFSYLYKCMS